MRRSKQNAKYDMRYAVYRAFKMTGMISLTSFFSVSFYFWVVSYLHGNEKYQIEQEMLHIWTIAVREIIDVCIRNSK